MIKTDQCFFIKNTNYKRKKKANRLPGYTFNLTLTNNFYIHYPTLLHRVFAFCCSKNCFTLSWLLSTSSGSSSKIISTEFRAASSISLSFTILASLKSSAPLWRVPPICPGPLSSTFFCTTAYSSS